MHVEQDLYRSYNWETLTLVQAREDSQFHETLLPPENHARFMFQGLSKLIGQDNPLEIARMLAIVNEINVIDPSKIGAPHSILEANRLRTISSRDLHYRQNTPEVYELVIEDLETGSLGELQKLIGSNRQQLGIATPYPTGMLIESIAKHSGIEKSFSNLSLDEIKSLLQIAGDIDREDILKGINSNYIFTTTGTSRNTAIQPIFKPRWSKGGYIEIGGSIGIHPLEIKENIGFESVTSVDIMSLEEAERITSITDYAKGVSVDFTEELKQRVGKNVRRLFSFDARTDNLSQITQDEQARPLVVGIHNVLVHITEKDKVIANATQAINVGHNYLWTSGGYNGNSPVLHNFVLEMDDGRVVNVFKESGTAVDIVTESDMQKVFVQKRA